MADKRFAKLVHLTPNWIKRAARTMLPTSTVEQIHERTVGEDYAPWMVSRETPLHRAIQRKTGQNPHLHRLVVHVTDHCNLNCAGCSHFSNISKPHFVDPDEFAADIERLAEIFSGITEIYLLGGEPLLHPQLVNFLASARTAFPKARINLLTNGVLLTRQPDEFWRAIRDDDIWLMSNQYPIKLPREQIEMLAKKWGVNFEWMEPMTEFFKLPIDLSGSQDPTHAFHSCGPLNNCVTLRDHRLYPCAYSAYSDILRERFDLDELSTTDSDSIAIDGDATPWEVFDFLCRPVPWCRFCDVDHVTTYQWGHSKGEITEWATEKPTERAARS